jgi:hypothetical protein
MSGTDFEEREWAGKDAEIERLRSEISVLRDYLIGIQRSCYFALDFVEAVESEDGEG